MGLSSLKLSYAHSPSSSLSIATAKYQNIVGHPLCYGMPSGKPSPLSMPLSPVPLYPLNTSAKLNSNIYKNPSSRLHGSAFLRLTPLMHALYSRFLHAFFTNYLFLRLHALTPSRTDTFMHSRFLMPTHRIQNIFFLHD